MEGVSKLQEYLTPQLAADYTGISRSKLSKLRQQGKGCQYIRVGESPTKAKILYKRSDLDQWLQQCTIKTFGGV